MAVIIGGIVREGAEGERILVDILRIPEEASTKSPLRT
jgi:hypothetical protein